MGYIGDQRDPQLLKVLQNITCATMPISLPLFFIVMIVSDYYAHRGGYSDYHKIVESMKRDEERRRRMIADQKK